MADRNNRDDDRGFWVKYGEYSQLAFVLPSCIFAGWLLGGLLDKWLGTTYLYMVFLLLGIAGGLIQVIRFVTREKD